MFGRKAHLLWLKTKQQQRFHRNDNHLEQATVGTQQYIYLPLDIPNGQWWHLIHFRKLNIFFWYRLWSRYSILCSPDTGLSPGMVSDQPGMGHKWSVAKMVISFWVSTNTSNLNKNLTRLDDGPDRSPIVLVGDKKQKTTIFGRKRGYLIMQQQYHSTTKPLKTLPYHLRISLHSAHCMVYTPCRSHLAIVQLDTFDRTDDWWSCGDRPAHGKACTL